MATRRDDGLADVRTHHDSGITLFASAVRPSVIWLCGTNITPTPAYPQPVLAHVSNDADNLSGRLLELRTQSLADQDHLAERVLVRPVFLRHRVIDDDHPERRQRYPSR